MTDEQFINSLTTKPEIKAQQTMIIIKHTCGCTITLSGGGHGHQRHNDVWCQVCEKHKRSLNHKENVKHT